MIFFRPALFLGSLFAFVLVATAAPLSRSTSIDFFRDVPSRNLNGLATRSDGRLLAGPTVTDLPGTGLDELLWSLEPSRDGKWFVGTGPSGKILEVTLDPKTNGFQSRLLIELKASHVFALRELADGSLLAGTSPDGALYLIREGKVVTRLRLPVDSIYDLVVQNDGSVLAATGNPGQIYRIDLDKFARAGVNEDEASPATLAQNGVTLFGEIRDRNVRRLLPLPDGRVIAGSSPKGNIYSFPVNGGHPLILLENTEAEVTDLLPDKDGSFYASVIFSGQTLGLVIESASKPDKVEKPDEAIEMATEDETSIEPFTGRSVIMWFPPTGFPEGVVSREKQAFYRLARKDNLVLISGGEQGDMLGYDPESRMTLSFPGTASAQVTSLARLPGVSEKFLLLRNNQPGLSYLDFNASGPRTAETRRLDLKGPASLGSLRFDRIREVAAGQIRLEIKTSSGTDEAEGWTEWTPLTRDETDAWQGAVQAGRSAKLRLTLPSDLKSNSQIDRARLYTLPQNHRPQLQEFHVAPPNYAINVNPPGAGSPPSTLSQLLAEKSGETNDSAWEALQSASVQPQPGMQIVAWNVVDADGDSLVHTYSIRRDGTEAWTDLVVDVPASHAQFDTSHLTDGVYFARLVSKETSPRTAKDRLDVTFEIDDLVIDHTAPEITTCTPRQEGDRLIVSVTGRDALSLLAGADFKFNSGVSQTVEQPADGILDGRQETFELSLPLSRVSGATSVEVTLRDAAGNARAQRLAL